MSLPLSHVTLVLGGARSGKSGYAERLVDGTLQGGPPRAALLIATADAAESARYGDAEMAARIAHHRQRHGPHWLVVEEAVDLAGVLRRHDGGPPVLVDCLTLWLSNLLLRGHDVAAASEALAATLATMQAEVVLVANEVGLGIVPDNALARRFRDEAGRLNMRLAALAGRVVFMVAGIPMAVKGMAQA